MILVHPYIEYDTKMKFSDFISNFCWMDSEYTNFGFLLFSTNVFRSFAKSYLHDRNIVFPWSE